MQLKDKSRLESMIGKSWMYKSTTYQFIDLMEVNDQVIISTDIKVLRFASDKAAGFIDDCLPADNLPSKTGGKMTIPGLDANVLTEVTNGLMQSFRDVQDAKGEDHIKIAINKANTKVRIASGVTSVAKVILQAQKQQ